MHTREALLTLCVIVNPRFDSSTLPVLPVVTMDTVEKKSMLDATKCNRGAFMWLCATSATSFVSVVFFAYFLSDASFVRR